jgi:hypothetical protein
MNKRNLTSTFYAPNKITVHNMDTGKKVDCDVIDYGEKRIVAAAYGAKINLNLTHSGVYEGKMAGMTLTYKK